MEDSKIIESRDEYFSVKISNNDKNIIKILQENIDYKLVFQRVMSQFFSGEESVELDEEGFHNVLELWIVLNVFSDEYVMENYKEDIKEIKALLYGERQSESN